MFREELVSELVRDCHSANNISCQLKDINPNMPSLIFCKWCYCCEKNLHDVQTRGQENEVQCCTVDVVNQELLQALAQRGTQHVSLNLCSLNPFFTFLLKSLFLFYLQEVHFIYFIFRNIFSVYLFTKLCNYILFEEKIIYCCNGTAEFSASLHQGSVCWCLRKHFSLLIMLKTIMML